jgi:hypothetical protein
LSHGASNYASFSQRTSRFELYFPQRNVSPESYVFYEARELTPNKKTWAQGLMDACLTE